VATDWTAISLAALGVAGTISGGFVGAWIQQRGQQWQERQRQRDLASEVVGTLVQLHGELTPDQVIPKKQDLTSQEIRQLDDETEALEVRSRAAVAQLFALAARHPSDEVRNLALQLAEALPGALVSASRGALSHIRDAPSRVEDRARAETDHAKVRRLLAALL
jgi:hypothetical protein